jgi:hypothetical protein
MALPRGVVQEEVAMALPTTMLAGRVTAVDRAARTITIGLRTLTVPPTLHLEQIDVGTNAAILYEQRGPHVLVAVEVRPLSV